MSLLIILVIVGGPLVCLFTVVCGKKIFNRDQNNDILTRRKLNNTVQSRVGNYYLI
jgi:hypothetical protein